MFRLKPVCVVFLVSCLVFCANTFARASEKPVKMKDLPEAVRKTVQEQSKGATLRGLSKEVEKGQTFYEAELKVNGHNKDLLIDSSGAIVEIEEVVAVELVARGCEGNDIKERRQRQNHQRRIHHEEQHHRGLRGARQQGGEEVRDKSRATMGN